jgi:hypothetical protein
MNAKQHNRQLRDEEFMKLYHETLNFLIDQGVKNARHEAIKFTIHHSHPRYNVSFDRAYPVVCNLLRQNKWIVAGALRRAMWEDIAGHVKALMASGDISIAKALEHVLLNCRASRFYISEAYAWRNVYRAANEHRSNLLKRLLKTA